VLSSLVCTAGVAATHGHNHVGAVGSLFGQLRALVVRQVDSDLVHHLDDLWVHALGGGCAGGVRLMMAVGLALEQCSAHL
jgi:hypothetical protein